MQSQQEVLHRQAPDPSLAEALVAVVVPRIPLAVGDAQKPANWYDVLVWHAVQLLSFPGNTTWLKSFAQLNP